MIVTMGEEQFYVPDIQKLGVPLVYLLRRLRWDPAVFPRLWRILRDFRPDIIHTNSEMAMSYAWPLARLSGIKSPVKISRIFFAVPTTGVTSRPT